MSEITLEDLPKIVLDGTGSAAYYLDRDDDGDGWVITVTDCRASGPLAIRGTGRAEISCAAGSIALEGTPETPKDPGQPPEGS